MAHHRFFSAASLAVALASVLASGSQAQTAAFTFAPGAVFNDYAPAYQEMGYLFTVKDSIPIFALGFYDSTVMNKKNTGFTEKHSVGVFDTATHKLLVQAVVSAGTTATLVGNFRYTETLFDGSGNAIYDPLTLSPGSYLIEGITSKDHFMYLTGAAGLLAPPGVTYAGSQFSSSPALNYVVGNKNHDNSAGYFGGNFLVTPLDPNNPPPSQPTPPPIAPSTPEPGSLSMGSLCVASAMWGKRRVRGSR